MEALSGLAMDDVRVHRNSPQPAKFGALAYAQGTDIHLGPGQDEHLPHEAWHVVQQKQGRVKATAQMKGQTISENVELEHEADTIEPKLDGFAVPQALRTAPQSASRTIQRKVEFKGITFPPKHNFGSNILENYHSKPETYVLRDDWKDYDPRRNIHLIDSRKCYLLGELHDRSTYVADTRNWSFVSRVREGLTEAPEAQGRYIEKVKQQSIKPSSGGEAITDRDFPLEDIHLNVMNWSLLAYDMLDPICATGSWSIGDFNQDPRAYIASVIGQNSQYEWLAKDIQRKEEDYRTAYDEAVISFKEKMDSDYIPSLLSLDFALSGIASVHVQQHMANANIFPRSPNRLGNKLLIESYLSSVKNNRTSLLSIIEDTRVLVGISKDSKKWKDVLAVEEDHHTIDPGATLALKGPREQMMKDKIESVPRPSLVQMGTNHVFGVSLLIDSVMPIFYPDRLEKYTFAGEG